MIDCLSLTQSKQSGPSAPSSASQSPRVRPTLRALSYEVATVAFSHFHIQSEWETVHQLSDRCPQLLYHIMTRQEADGEIDLYPVLTFIVPEVSALSHCFSFKEPVAIGTWQADLIVSIGIQTPLRLSPRWRNASQKFIWSPRILTMLPTGIVSLSTHCAHRAVPWLRSRIQLRKPDTRKTASWTPQTLIATISRINQEEEDIFKKCFKTIKRLKGDYVQICNECPF